MPRLRLIVAAIAVLVLAGPAFAQMAKATGTVKDTNGKPLKGATVRAVNHEASPPEITSTTDDKGRWAMIGLRSGPWTFIVEAPGFNPVRTDSSVRVAGSPPMNFVLARDPGPIPGTLDRNILQLVNAAHALRDQGQYEQALAAYDEILTQNPKLTSVSFVMGDVYRKQAAGAADSATRQVLLDHAIQAYTPLLNDTATSERARAEIEATRAEIQALPR